MRADMGLSRKPFATLPELAAGMGEVLDLVGGLPGEKAGKPGATKSK